VRLDLIRSRFVQRSNRFFAHVEMLSGEPAIAHCANTGTMATLLHAGSDAWLTRVDSPTRKLAYTLTLLGLPGGAAALVDTALPNKIVAEGILAGKVAELSGYSELCREVRYGTQPSRCDLVLDGNPRRPGPCYVEVKNVTMASMRAARRADFPDARTERGLKHLHELSELAKTGVRAVMFYLVSRNDCDKAGIADYVDPAYAQGLRRAVAAGVEIICYRAVVTDKQVHVGVPCPFILPERQALPKVALAAQR
jgi:sugar fermentation stimulation protein A